MRTPERNRNNRLNRDRFKKKLKYWLSVAPDVEFLGLVWSVHAVQSERAISARKYINFPAEAATSDFSAEYRIHGWELETLVNEFLCTQTQLSDPNNSRRLNCREFHNCGRLIDFLRKIDNAETGLYLKRVNIFVEMHRLLQRQLPWQRQHISMRHYYKFAYIYNQKQCGDFFFNKHGISISDFMLVGFYLHAISLTQPVFSYIGWLSNAGITAEKVEKALSILAIKIDTAKYDAISLRKDFSRKFETPSISYQPTLIRRFPVIAFDSNHHKLMAPLPPLVVHRTTSGIYYDLVAGPGKLRNEVAKAFEVYTQHLLTSLFPKFEVHGEMTYDFGNSTRKTSDILIEYKNKIYVVFELKATKLTIEAQYAEDPIAQVEQKYTEIKKAVLQIWKFFAHARMNDLNDLTFHPDAVGVVVTLDNWLLSSELLQKKILRLAAEDAKQERDIQIEDFCPIAFASIIDIEDVALTTNEEGFIEVVRAATSEKFAGWMLPSVATELKVRMSKSKDYPFDLADVLPWWKDLAAKTSPT